MSNDEQMARASEAQVKYQEMLMQKPHVVGVAIGLAQKGGITTDKVALVVLVDEKVPMDKLKAGDMIPSELDGVPVDVQAVGEIRAF